MSRSKCIVGGCEWVEGYSGFAPQHSRSLVLGRLKTLLESVSMTKTEVCFAKSSDSLVGLGVPGAVAAIANRLRKHQCLYASLNFREGIKSSRLMADPLNSRGRISMV